MAPEEDDVRGCGQRAWPAHPRQPAAEGQYSRFRADRPRAIPLSAIRDPGPTSQPQRAARAARMLRFARCLDAPAARLQRARHGLPYVADRPAARQECRTGLRARRRTAAPRTPLPVLYLSLRACARDWRIPAGVGARFSIAKFASRCVRGEPRVRRVSALFPARASGPRPRAAYGRGVPSGCGHCNARRFPRERCLDVRECRARCAAVSLRNVECSDSGRLRESCCH